eukprot:TRINITY_DN4731_c0_g1_i9.p1 TRINITY_DN4731_c0_g1~~TRINITY_DN4731_c0_g1_i9.p1  ORF type:complete len:330 (+),score=48.58 TRINITY_DN4731_c0_g1_i9:238-1227(+)
MLTRLVSRSLPLRSYATLPKTTGFLVGKHVLTSSQFNRAQIEELMDVAQYMKDSVREHGVLRLLEDKVSCNLFYEPSTRTTGSFQSAMLRLGGKVLPVVAATSSIQKGETLEDTIRTLQNFVDIIVVRHPEIGSAAKAAEVADIPIINCGDGANEHPTQALLDLFTIRSTHGRIDGLNIVLVGDLKYGRTVHSLSRMLTHFDVKLHFVSPKELVMPEKITSELDKSGMKYRTSHELDSVLPIADVIYMTRVQKERFPYEEDYLKVKDLFIISPETLKPCKSNMILLHPLPRVNEIEVEVDNDPRAFYFKQPGFGIFMRMALLASCLGRV